MIEKERKALIIRTMRRIIAKLCGLFFIVFSLSSLMFHGREYHSVVPAIDWLWDLTKSGLGIFVGIALMRADPETQVGIRSILKFFASIFIGVSLLFSLAHWSGLIFLVLSCFIYWLFRDASVKQQFDGYVREYEKKLSKTHPKLDTVRKLLSKIVWGILILFLTILVVSLLFAIIRS